MCTNTHTHGNQLVLRVGTQLGHTLCMSSNNNMFCAARHHTKLPELVADRV